MIGEGVIDGPRVLWRAEQRHGQPASNTRTAHPRPTPPPLTPSPFPLCANTHKNRSLGRKFWLVEASFQMMLAEVAMTAVIATHVGADGQLALPPPVVVGLLVVVCVFIAGHAWGWGPMVRS